jgi:hypothetical protein
MSRPSRFINYPIVKDTPYYEVPCTVILDSGFTEDIISYAAQDGLFLAAPRISESCIMRGGGLHKNRASIWHTDSFYFYRDGTTLVPAQIEIKRNEDTLSTSFIAEVRSDLPKGVDLVIGAPVLTSLGDVGIGSDFMVLLHPKTTNWDQRSLDALLQKAVLILGNDSTDHVQVLRQIEVAVNQISPFEGWLLRDYEDAWTLDLTQKLLLMAAASSFIIIEDSQSSGHLTEIGFLGSLRTPVAFLRERGCPSSWMSDAFLLGENRKLFEYDLKSDPTSLWRAANAACGWAKQILPQRALRLHAKYPWRQKEIELFKDTYIP